MDEQSMKTKKAFPAKIALGKQTHLLEQAQLLNALTSSNDDGAACLPD